MKNNLIYNLLTFSVIFSFTSIVSQSLSVLNDNVRVEEDKSVLFMSVSEAKFRKPVLPNDEISFEVEKINNVKSVYKFMGLAYNNTNKVCEAEFSAMIIEKSNNEIL